MLTSATILSAGSACSWMRITMKLINTLPHCLLIIFQYHLSVISEVANAMFLLLWCLTGSVCTLISWELRLEIFGNWKQNKTKQKKTDRKGSFSTFPVCLCFVFSFQIFSLLSLPSLCFHLYFPLIFSCISVSLLSFPSWVCHFVSLVVLCHFARSPVSYKDERYSP